MELEAVMSTLSQRLKEAAGVLKDRSETMVVAGRMIDAAHAITEAIRLIEAQDKLLAAYRTGGCPSDRILDVVRRRDEILAALKGEED